MKRRILATAAGFGLAVLFLFCTSLCAPKAVAQVNGVPASVTSPGFGGRAINGTPASVTSLGRQGYAPSRGGTYFNPIPSGGRNNARNNKERNHRHDARPYGYYGGIYAVPVPVPYADDVDANGDGQYDDQYDPGYQGGPTIFDRRGSGAASYIPPVADNSGAHVSQSQADAAVVEPPPDPTTLIFKDGHRTEVVNYAIVGQTLFDLTSGHPRKVAMADLDIEATQKQNDERGVTFQVPPAS